MRTSAAVEPCGDPGAAAKRGPQRRAGRLGTNLEVLRLTFTETVLDNLRETASRELEGHERDRVRFSLANTAGGRRRRNSHRLLVEQRHQIVDQMDAGFVQGPLQHLATPSRFCP